MIKIKYFKIMITAITALLSVGMMVSLYMQFSSRDDNVIEVYLSDGQTESVQFEELAMIPGDSLEYIIKLKSNDINNGYFTLDFAEISEAEERSLKDFAYVKILIDDKVICDELLSERFKGKDIVLPFDIANKANTELKVIYYMPIDVGNEAKNAEAIFELRLTAENE